MNYLSREITASIAGRHPDLGAQGTHQPSKPLSV